MSGTIRSLRKEVYVSLKEGGRVYKINHYDRSSKKYSLSPVNDINLEIFRRGSTVAYSVTY